MDILQQYSQFVGKSGLVRTVQESTELRLAEQYAALNDELSKLRMSTLGAVHVAADGGVSVSPSAGLTATQQRIVELERQLEQLVKNAKQIGELLDKCHANSVQELRERASESRSILDGKPISSWDELRRVRDLGRSKGQHLEWLPGDWANSDEYLACEAKIREEMKAAKSSMESTNTALEKIGSLR